MTIDAETDTRIDGMQRFLRTAGGEVYGLVKDGRIHLDPKVATSETAVHEYTHLWGDMLRRKDPEQWSHTVKELKEWLNWISQNKLLYADKEKIQALIDKQQTNLADVNYLNLDHVAKKVKDFENPKLFDGKFQK